MRVCVCVREREREEVMKRGEHCSIIPQHVHQDSNGEPETTVREIKE